MSKIAEEKKLVEEKAINYIQEATKKYNEFIKKLNEDTGLCMVGRIKPVGKPDIFIDWYKDRPKKGILTGKDTHRKIMEDRMNAYLDKVKVKCAELGITIGVRIDPLEGAVMMPQLTREKMKEIQDGISAGVK